MRLWVGRSVGTAAPAGPTERSIDREHHELGSQGGVDGTELAGAYAVVDHLVHAARCCGRVEGRRYPLPRGR